MPQLAILQRCFRILTDERNFIPTIEPIQATIAHPSAPMIIFFAPTKDQGEFTKYPGFTSIQVADDSFNEDYLRHDSMKLSTLWMRLATYCSGCRSLTRPYTVSDVRNELWLPIWLLICLPVSLVYWWTRFELLEQRLQIIWELCMWSIITLKCFKVVSNYDSRLPLLIGTIGTLLDDRIDSLWGEQSAPTLFNVVRRMPTIEYEHSHTMAYEEGY